MAGVSVQPWEIAYQDLLLLEECGEGSFGRVYRAQWHEAEVVRARGCGAQKASNSCAPPSRLH